MDLSQPIRLSGLSSGAKLHLILLSRSPSVVSVALQVPQTEGDETTRLTAKVPSNTTLWLLLRQFESSLEGMRPIRNFTARATPQTNSGGLGPGRLFYETPVLHVMGRELSSFTDLQKTLAQLGFNSGSVLLRLSFRKTDRLLEEAIEEIDQHFKSVSGENAGEAHSGDAGNAGSAPESSQPSSNHPADMPPPPEPRSPSEPRDIPPEITSELSPPSVLPASEVQNISLLNDNTIAGPSQRPITVFAPPSNSTPVAAQRAYNEKDFEPTIDHAKLHQSRLANSGRNKTLPSDAQLAAQTEAETKRRADITSVKIKVRFPDQSTVISEFSNFDTSVHLYDHVKGLMENENEPFSLNFSTGKGPQSISKETNLKLISGLGMVGSVLVNVIWEAGASNKARTGPVLREAFRQKAAEIQYEEPEGEVTEEKENANAKEKGTEQKERGGKKGGVPKWLKLPGKK